jgi:fermentation-respiration switch protein FrsA (DUF1100 family)
MATNDSGRFHRTYWLRLAAFTVAVLALPVLAMLIYLVQRQLDILVTPVRQPLDQTPADFDLPYEDISLTSADGLELAAWYIPGTKPEAIILIHGINTNRAVMLPTAALLAEAGYNLLLIDLRGHGESEGDLISYGYWEALDVQAGSRFLAARPDIEDIGVIGTSLGGAAVVRAAATEPSLAAVVVEISFSSLPDAVEDAIDELTIFPHWPLAPLVVALAERRVGLKISQVDSARDLATMAPRPVLIIHTTDDHLFPLRHAQKMYEAAQEPKELWVIEALGHEDPAVAHEAEYRARVITFFEEAFAE